jgi:hypothetical protein
VLVQTYRDYFDEYRRHREAKALGPDGRPCRSSTRGHLGPRTVAATRLVRVGKESTRLVLPGTDDTDDCSPEYRELRCLRCGGTLRGRQRKWCSETCRKHAARLRAAAG